MKKIVIMLILMNLNFSFAAASEYYVTQFGQVKNPSALTAICTTAAQLNTELGVEKYPDLIGNLSQDIDKNLSTEIAKLSWSVEQCQSAADQFISITTISSDLDAGEFTPKIVKLFSPLFGDNVYLHIKSEQGSDLVMVQKGRFKLVCSEYEGQGFNLNMCEKMKVMENWQDVRRQLDAQIETVKTKEVDGNEFF